MQFLLGSYVVELEMFLDISNELFSLNVLASQVLI